MHGHDRGSLFVLMAEKATLGRGDENDVVFADLRASRRHAELARLPSGTWRLKDLGSQNGVIWNGKVTREADLNAGDIITVGETAFEFVTDESGTKFLHTPAKNLPAEYLAGREVAVAAPKASVAREVPSADFSGLAGVAGMGAAAGGNSGSAEKRKKILIGAVVLMGLWLFLDDASKKTGSPTAKVGDKSADKKDAERDLASYLPAMPMTSALNSAETFFQAGFREFREKNYLRARVQFETALQISPAHGLARSYLQQSDQAIEIEVRQHLERGRRDLDAGKLKTARAHFEAVQRLLLRDPENPAFTEAKDQLKIVLGRAQKGGGRS